MQKQATKSSADGITIASTLLKFFRERQGLEWTQDFLAKKLRVAVSDYSKCEQGKRSSEFIRSHIGLIADALALTGQEVLDLQSATQADDFLRGIRKPRRTLRARGHKARAFQSLLILPLSETRQWLRFVFAGNTLRDLLPPGSPGTSEPPRATRKRKTVIDQDLVEPNVLREIRVSLQEACEYARAHATPLNTISQMLLYWARSLSHPTATETDRRKAIAMIEGALPDATGDFVVMRHLAHALCELGRHGAMCDYLSKTDGEAADSSSNMEYIVRRSADAGEGLQVLECTLKFIESDHKKALTPLCALDLRTTAQLLTTYRDGKTGSSTALSHLLRTKELLDVVSAYVELAQPDWCAGHNCANEVGKRCQDFADRYARSIIREVRRFSETLPEAARELKVRTKNAMN